MILSESIQLEPRRVEALRRLARQGEGTHLEFKRKVSHPDKVIREMVAFANTGGGTLLIGVDDDGRIPGVKFPEEELVVLKKALQQRCRPPLTFEEQFIPVSAHRFVVQVEIPVSPRRPHVVVFDGRKECYVRVRDMSVKASREMQEIVRRMKKPRDIRFIFGSHEKQLMEYLEERGSITLQQFRALAKLNRFNAAKKLILLVLAGVLRVEPTEKGDFYSRA